MRQIERLNLFCGCDIMKIMVNEIPQKIPRYIDALPELLGRRQKPISAKILGVEQTDLSLLVSTINRTDSSIKIIVLERLSDVEENTLDLQNFQNNPTKGKNGIFVITSKEFDKEFREAGDNNTNRGIFMSFITPYGDNFGEQ